MEEEIESGESKKKFPSSEAQGKRKHIMLDQEFGRKIEGYVRGVTTVTTFVIAAVNEYIENHPEYQDPTTNEYIVKRVEELRERKRYEEISKKEQDTTSLPNIEEITDLSEIKSDIDIILKRNLNVVYGLLYKQIDSLKKEIISLRTEQGNPQAFQF